MTKGRPMPVIAVNPRALSNPKVNATMLKVMTMFVMVSACSSSFAILSYWCS
jgi:hypothetical protein